MNVSLKMSTHGHGGGPVVDGRAGELPVPPAGQASPESGGTLGHAPDSGGDAESPEASNLSATSGDRPFCLHTTGIRTVDVERSDDVVEAVDICVDCGAELVV